MYFKDLTKYTYMKKEDSLNIGWLEKGHLINKGEVPEEFIEKLWRYLRYPVHVCRGFHVCSFCKKQGRDKLPVTSFKDEKRRNGYYEIRVFGKDGKIYAAPGLIFHYIIKHNYKPPQEFIDAVIDSGDIGSGGYYQKILKYLDGDSFWIADDCTRAGD